MKNETLYWTIGGVALGLLALFGLSHGAGGAAPAPSGGGGGIPASALVSEVNTVNQTAAAVEADRINAVTSYAIHSSDNSVNVFDTLSHAAEGELATIEGAQTARFTSHENTLASEYAANENYLTAQAQIQGAESINSANNALALQQAKIGENIAHFTSDNQTTQARIASGTQKTTSFLGFLGNIGSAIISKF